MSGILCLTQPRDLLTKLSHEIGVLAAEPRNSYAAINALRDAYHLSEWIWHGCLKNNPALRAQIMQAAGTKKTWYKYVNDKFPDNSLIGELCNGSKHFERDDTDKHKATDKVEATHRAEYGSPLFAYNTGLLGYGVDGFFVRVKPGRIVSVTDLLQSAHKFWVELFDRFPQLG